MPQEEKQDLNQRQSGIIKVFLEGSGPQKTSRGGKHDLKNKKGSVEGIKSSEMKGIIRRE